MAAQGEPLSNQRPFSKERRNTSGPDSPKQLPASTEEKANFSFDKNLITFLGKFSISLWLLLAAFCLGALLAGGYVLGKVSPAYEVTVQPFEISPETGKGATFSGKNASDIVVDILNDAASHASQFHGTEYYKYDGTGIEPISLHQTIKVPVQTSYGLALKGVSVDSLFQLYDKQRYKQWTVSGDILSSPKGHVGRIRFNDGDTARSWQTPPSDADPSELVQKATYMMLTSQAPELLGKSYLQQGNYEKAAEVFRQWGIHDPRNWKPSYYLSLAYGYQKHKEQEASNLATWSKNIKDHESNGSFIKRHQISGSEKDIVANLAQTTKAILETKDTSESEPSQHELDTLKQAVLELQSLYKNNPSNVDYLIQLARVLDKEAMVELRLDPISPRAYALAKQAVDNLDEALEEVPGNGGLHEQRAILLLDLVTIMKKQGKEPGDIREKENEEVKEYIRALELRPTETSPLWGAVYAQIGMGNNEDAVDLARTITLLQPDSKEANIAYIVALERANMPGKKLDREKEAEEHLTRLLPKLRTSDLEVQKNQLKTLWFAAQKNNHRRGLDLIAQEAKRNFSTDSTFDEPTPFVVSQSTVALPFPMRVCTTGVGSYPWLNHWGC